MNQSNKSAAYKFTMNLKSIQIMLPISILSFLFSQSPVFDGLLNLLETYGFDSTSTLSIRAERTYAFLLFNGLLALLIKNLGTSKGVPESSSLKTAIKTTVFEVEEEDDEVLAGDHEEKDKDGGCDDTGDILAADEEEDDDEDGILADDEVDEDDILAYEDDIFADEEENDQDEIVAMEEEDEDHDFLADDDEEEQEEVVEWGISVEELNSKCDDFIKNMRHML